MGIVGSLPWIIPVQLGAYFGYLTFGFIADKIGRRQAFVLYMVDVDSAKWGSLGDGAGVPMGWVYRREARLLAGFEQTAARRAFSTVVVNDAVAALAVWLNSSAEAVMAAVSEPTASCPGVTTMVTLALEPTARLPISATRFDPS